MLLIALAAMLVLVPADGPTAASRNKRVRHAAQPALGVYRGASNVAGVARFERWLGRRVKMRLDFLPGASWKEIEGSSWQLRRWGTSNGSLVLTIPILPGPWDRSYNGGVSLRRCSSGAYDKHWDRLAHNLVTHRLGDSTLRVGHEFNGRWYAWRAAGQEAAFAGCYRRVVRSMRAVRGSSFRFTWNPALGRLDADPLLAYPGDQYVDTIGIDVYDQSWHAGTYPIPRSASPKEALARRQRAWSRQMHGDFGLKFWSRFARTHKKPLSIPEWGLTRRKDGHGGGDNPYFIQQMHRFLNDPTNRVAYSIYFEHDARDGEHRLTGSRFKRAAKRFRTYFSKSR